MSKKIAMVLILIMAVNICAWAESDSAITTIWICGAVGIILLISMTVVVMVVEADSPDDGIRLVSGQSSRLDTGTGSGTALNVLQKIDLGVTQDNKVYMGLRLQF